MDRRHFLNAAACVSLAACTRAEPPLPPGDWLGSDPARGHRLRAAPPAPQGPARRVGVLVVGAGMAGLSAAWWLQRCGLDDFLVLDAEAAAGGNARGGANAVSRFPMGAHYLPLPPPECGTLRALLAELGAIEGDPHVPRPRYAAERVCAAPQERLFRFGHWQEGLLPEAGLSRTERDQTRRFLDRMATLRRPAAGPRAFTLPMAQAPLTDAARALDRITMRDWLLREGFDAAPLHWYVDYACRDDFGTPASRVSAWAGLHYFASRSGEGEGLAHDLVLTAPEGNGWIIDGLAACAGERLETGCAVSSLVARKGGGWVATVLRDDGAAAAVEARAVIWAAPLFLAARLIPGLPAALRDYALGIDYAPWVMAQLTLATSPPEAPGAERAWDNVLYGAASLGVVVATHQQFRLAPAPSVWTWYHALTGDDTLAERRRLLVEPRETWARLALRELAPAYPALAEHLSRIDVVRHGHAMSRPLPGFLTAAGRLLAADGLGDLQFAHADVSGFSICEEAHARGVAAAERVAARVLGRKPDRLAGLFTAAET